MKQWTSALSPLKLRIGRLILRRFLILWACLGLHFQCLSGVESSDRSGGNKPSVEAFNGVRQEQRVLEVFVKDGCTYCDKSKEFLRQLQAEHPEVSIIERNVSKDSQALADLKAIAAVHKEQRIVVPTFRVGDKVITGFSGPETTGKQLMAMLGLNHQVEFQRIVKLPLVGEVSLEKYGLLAFTIVVGLLDGFNPCALWVLLFILCMLVHFQSRGRMLAVAGTFVLISGIVYFLFMVAWLNFFLLLGMGRWIQIVLGLFALVAGGIHVKDYFAFRKGVSLSTPDSAKTWIGRQTRRVLDGENLIASLLAVSILAFLVNGVELLCTAGLPAIYTHVLSSQELPTWQYYGYLVIYNIAYIAENAIVVIAAVITFNPRRLDERRGRILKLVSGLVMLVLALLLLFKPDWLSYVATY